jgi:hypothetical protein
MDITRRTAYTWRPVKRTNHVRASAIAGLIGYNVAREGGALISAAIGRGSFVFFSTMTLFIALLAVLVPALT